MFHLDETDISVAGTPANAGTHLATGAVARRWAFVACGGGPTAEAGKSAGLSASTRPYSIQKPSGENVAAFIAVGMSGSRFYPEFRDRAAELPEILECHSITGEGSHLLKIRVSNTSDLEKLLAEIQSWPGVQWTSTSLVLSSLKETLRLPLSPTPEP